MNGPSGHIHADGAGGIFASNGLAMARCGESVVVGRVRNLVAVSDMSVRAADQALLSCGVGEVGVGLSLDAPVIACIGYDSGRGFEAAAVAERSPGHRDAAWRGVLDDRGWPSMVCALLKDWRIVSVEQASAILLDGGAGFRVGEIRSDGGRERFERCVTRVLEYIRAGDAYQVNLAHRLWAQFEGCPRAFFAALLMAGAPRHGAYLEFTDAKGQARVVASASPELFLECDAGKGVGAGRAAGLLRTRPMKGTLAGTSAASASQLAASSKDRAELAMIVDLMRNDLGRVCELGSVRVEAAHAIERHGEGSAALLQATATVAGVPRAGLRWSEVLGAMFPGGSVTGAPKVRAMQIIDELEEARRGPYCGSIGLWMPDGSATLNIAIRTACITGERVDGDCTIRQGRLDWWVGAGVVADSTPQGEWEETLAKAGVLMRALGDKHSELAGTNQNAQGPLGSSHSPAVGDMA